METDCRTVNQYRACKVGQTCMSDLYVLTRVIRVLSSAKCGANIYRELTKELRDATSNATLPKPVETTDMRSQS